MGYDSQAVYIKGGFSINLEIRSHLLSSRIIGHHRYSLGPGALNLPEKQMFVFVSTNRKLLELSLLTISAQKI